MLLVEGANQAVWKSGLKAQDILDALSSSDIVQRIYVIIQVEEPGKQALRARASLKNDFTLHVTEAFGKGFRSYPHHLHFIGERDVRECPEVFIKDYQRCTP